MFGDFSVDDWNATEDVNSLNKSLFSKHVTTKMKKKRNKEEDRLHPKSNLMEKRKRKSSVSVHSEVSGTQERTKKIKKSSDFKGDRISLKITDDSQRKKTLETENSEPISWEKNKKKKKSSKKNKYAHLAKSSSLIDISSTVDISAKAENESQQKSANRKRNISPEVNRTLTSSSSNSESIGNLKGSSSSSKKKKRQGGYNAISPKKSSDDYSNEHNPVLTKNKKSKPKGKKISNISNESILENGQSHQSGSKKSVQILNVGKQEMLSNDEKIQSHPNSSLMKKNKSLVERMTEQLNAARFRYLNEKLYSQTGSVSLSMFCEDKEAFNVYHEGFSSQVSKWPVNPVDVIIKNIKSLPRNMVIADFGCGDAKLAQSVFHKVHSFDLVAVNKHVTECDISKVPLKNSSIDVAVFSLSLMGTNMIQYVTEAHRVLKNGGLLKIAEVCSRFSNQSKFIKSMNELGFKLCSQDTTNKMFWMFDFKKTGKIKKEPTSLFLNPCLYKKR